MVRGCVPQDVGGAGGEPPACGSGGLKDAVAGGTGVNDGTGRCGDRGRRGCGDGEPLEAGPV